MANKAYHIELVQKEPPYICMGFMKKTSIKNGRLEFTSSEKQALTIKDRETMGKALNLIAEHNMNKYYVYLMNWITEVDSKKRVFQGEIEWD